MIPTKKYKKAKEFHVDNYLIIKVIYLRIIKLEIYCKNIVENIHEDLKLLTRELSLS